MQARGGPETEKHAVRQVNPAIAAIAAQHSTLARCACTKKLGGAVLGWLLAILIHHEFRSIRFAQHPCINRFKLSTNRTPDEFFLHKR